MNFAIIPWGKDDLNNKIFDVDDLKYNRDNLMTPYRDFKKQFEDNGDQINTIDMYDDLKLVDYFLFLDLDLDWIVKLVKLNMQNKMIYCNSEPEVVKAINCKTGYGKLKKLFKYILTWDEELVDNKRIFKRIIPYYFEPNFGQIPFNKRKLMTNISSEKKSLHPREKYSERERVISFFEKNYPQDFDCYGFGWKKEEHVSYKGCPESKIKTYHKYRFALCLENMDHTQGYITEKIYDCLCAGIVPVYSGADNIAEYVPDKCYICYDKFNNLNELVFYLKSMSEEQYMKYYDNIREFVNGSICERLSGRIYADNIYNAVKHGDKDEMKIAGYLKLQLQFVCKRRSVVTTLKKKVKSLLRKKSDR